jgi:aryl-alcohol dehydrogenase-like predicted oxidoreductase
MRYARLGASGLIVSRIALGCLTFGARGDGSSILYKVDRAEAARIVARADELGINLFDTSDFYADGASEEFLGAAIGGLRQRLVISSKVGFRVGPAVTHAGLSRRHIHESIDATLRRLGTDYLDLYFAHKEDPLTPLDETLQAFDEIVRAGKVRYLGFSNWSAWRAATALERQRRNGWAPFVAGQVNHSLIQRDTEYDLLPFMAQSGVGGMAWSPLAGGFLTGKYDRDNVDRPGTRVAMSTLPYDRHQALAVVDALGEVAAARGCTVAQAALAWVIAKPGVATALIGVSRLGQLDELATGADLVLADDEIARLEAASPMRPLYPHWHIDASQDEAAFTALGIDKPAAVGGAGRGAVGNRH